MARKKETAVMENLAEEPDFLQFIDRVGLNVIDVYQTWCGPCKPVQVLFKKLKMNLGNVSFGTADSSAVPQLEPFMGTCEPIFLLYGGGELLGKIVGCDAPVIERVITEQAEIEKDIASGKIKREKANNPTELTAPSQTAVPEEEATPQEEPREINKIVSCLIIKPDILKEEEKVKEIIELIELNGITIVLDETKTLGSYEIEAIYGAHSQEYKDYMKSDTVRILGLTKGEAGLNIIKLTQEMVGHEEPATAKQKNPKSIRARFGEDLMKNAVHCSASAKEAEAEMTALFPDFTPPIASISSQMRDQMIEEKFQPKAILEQTVTLIRPSANSQHKEQIINDAKEAGYAILESVEITMSENQFDKLYSRHAEAEYFGSLKQEMMSGPCTVLRLEKEDAMTDWRALIGPMVDAKENAPDSLRAKYHVGDVNPIHSASNQSQVKIECDLFFGSGEAQKEITPAPESAAEVETAAE